MSHPAWLDLGTTSSFPKRFGLAIALTDFLLEDASVTYRFSQIAIENLRRQ